MKNNGNEELGRWNGTSNANQTMRIGELAVTLKVTGTATGGALAVVEFAAPPTHPGLGMQVHQHTTKVMYVVAGLLAVTLGEATTIMRPGNSIVVAPGVAHRFWNPSTAPVTYLTMLSPGGAECFYPELAKLLADAPAWPPADATALTALGDTYDHILTPRQTT